MWACRSQIFLLFRRTDRKRSLEINLGVSESNSRAIQVITLKTNSLKAQPLRAISRNIRPTNGTLLFVQIDRPLRSYVYEQERQENRGNLKNTITIRELI